MASGGLRIGLVGPLPPPFGGMANQTRQLAELLRGEGMTVDLVQTNAAYRPRWISRVRFVRAGFRLVSYLFALWRQTGRSDLVHVMANSGWSWHLFAVPAICTAKLRGIPVVVNYRGGEAESFLASSSRLVRASMALASALIVPSGFLKAVFERSGIDASIVPNVVDTTRFNSAGRTRVTRRRLLVARHLEPIYDNETAIRAFAIVHREYPDATLTIAGSGPLQSALRELAGRLGLSAAVRFVGRLDREAMVEAYACADIAINPSRVDNMPNSVLEALACGVPVVSTDVGGVPFIVEDGRTALLVPARSPEAMASAILRLMTEPDLAETLVSNALAEVRKYTWPRVWPVLAAVYGRACGECATARAGI